jgi:hypothetical protein
MHHRNVKCRVRVRACGLESGVIQHHTIQHRVLLAGLHPGEGTRSVAESMLHWGRDYVPTNFIQRYKRKQMGWKIVKNGGGHNIHSHIIREGLELSNHACIGRDPLVFLLNGRFLWFGTARRNSTQLFSFERKFSLALNHIWPMLPLLHDVPLAGAGARITPAKGRTVVSRARDTPLLVVSSPLECTARGAGLSAPRRVASRGYEQRGRGRGGAWRGVAQIPLPPSSARPAPNRPAS